MPVIKKIPYLNILLFGLTVLTTLVAGAHLNGVDLLSGPWAIIKAGAPFSAALIIILLSHELSHYFASRKHSTLATLPYFIPAPPPVLIGTFGAVIKMKSPILSRRALVDIGASGPITGFFFSLAACIIGLANSHIVPKTSFSGISLGDSALFHLLSRLILGKTSSSQDVMLNPVAFAGWVGLFMTSLNLLPIGQLDGGHVMYAFVGRFQKALSTALVIALAFLGLFYWKGWLLWAGLMMIIGLKHPPVYEWEAPLDPRRRYVGLFVLIIFALTFTPNPFSLG